MAAGDAFLYVYAKTAQRLRHIGRRAFLFIGNFRIFVKPPARTAHIFRIFFD